MKFILFVTGFFLVTSHLSAQKTSSADDAQRMQNVEKAFGKIDSIFTTYAHEKKFPSITYGIVVDGKLIHTMSSGSINLAKNVEASQKSAYHIASMTKSITAMAIVKLRDNGKLKLDDPVSEYIPEAGNLQALTKDAPSITIRDLLIHNAGFPEDNPWGDRQLGRTDEWLKSLFKEGISFSTATGTGYEYSNLGYATLGLIIKSVSGTTYQEYITENIFKPLGMNNTWWDYEDVPEDQLAVGYRLEDGKYVAQPLLHSGSFGAMGGLITTVEDFSKYMAFHLSAWPARDDNESGPVNRSSVREMHHGWNFARLWMDEKNAEGDFCPIVDFYGYGLHLYVNCEGRRTITHSGGLPGFGSQWRILPDYGIGIVGFANYTYAGMGSPVGSALDSLVVWADLKLKAIPPSTILEKRKKEIIALLPSWEGAEESGIFADNFFEDYFISNLKEKAQTVFAAAGKINSVSEVVATNALRGYFILYGTKANIRIYFTLSPETEPKIQAFSLSIVDN